MASSLYNLALDFSKELNYTKAIMARQGDKGITVTVKPFLNGLQMDTSGGTFTLKGTTPSNRYVDSVATSVTSEEVTFSLNGTFMSEAGYYKHCYVEYRKDNQILTTQDIIFFSLGVSDISQGQADEYVSQLEELIRKYNETFDAFMAEIEGRVDSLNQQITDLTGQAKTLQDKLDALKEEISKLGNLQVMYSNSIDFGGYDYLGNPNIAPVINDGNVFSLNNAWTKVTPHGTFATSEKIADGDMTVGIGMVPWSRYDFSKLTVGKRYTLTIPIRINETYTGDVSRLFIRLRCLDKDNQTIVIITAMVPKDTPVGVFTNISASFNVQSSTEVSHSWYAQVGASGDPTSRGSIDIGYNIKLEEGSNTTPYQPNLLDDPYWLGKTPLGKNIRRTDVGNSLPRTTTEYQCYLGNIEGYYEANQDYVITMKATKPATQTLGLYLLAGSQHAGNLMPVEGLTDTWQLNFRPTKEMIDAGVRNQINIFQVPQSTKGEVKIEWIKLEKGNIRTPNIGEYKYRGTGMRDSNNPYDYVWDIEPSYVENNLATDIKVAEITGKANNYTDGKVAQVNSNLLTVINTLEKRVSTNSNNILDNTTKIGANTSSINTIRKSMPLFAVYGEGTDLSDVPTGTKLPIGALIATDFAHTASDLPYTISSDGNTLTATRNCVLLFEGSVKLHGNNTIKYAYVKIRKNGSDTNFANVGSSAALNYMTAQAGQYVHTLVTGDKVEFTVALDTAGKLFHTQLLSLKISEIKPV
ncbi:hypothetical protein HQ956_09315 [Enterococcus faecium]|nr:hypothetical protein [Enterococcus faecium]NTR54711.1 hypothetical protein [Enterococcus faecium]